MNKKQNIALQLYSIRNFAAKDFFKALEWVKEVGYDGVEFAGLHGCTPEDIKSIVTELNLTPISAHVPFDELACDTAACIAKYKLIGCKFVVIPWMDKSKLPGKAEYPFILSKIKDIAAECEKQDLTLLYHNHDFEFEKHNGEYLLDILFNDAPQMQTEIDTCWVNVGGEEPTSYVKKYKGRAPIVHLKDFVNPSGQKEGLYGLIGNAAASEKRGAGFEFRPLGFGCQNIHSLIEAAEYAAAEWLVIEQDSPDKGRTEQECAKLSIEYLRKTMAKIGK